MKSIKELRDEGIMNTRLYNCICRGIWWSFYTRVFYIGINPSISYEEIENFTPDYILSIFDEEEMLNHWRGFGQKSLEELRSLV